MVFSLKLLCLGVVALAIGANSQCNYYQSGNSVIDISNRIGTGYCYPQLISSTRADCNADGTITVRTEFGSGTNCTATGLLDSITTYSTANASASNVSFSCGGSNCYSSYNLYTDSACPASGAIPTQNLPGHCQPSSISTGSTAVYCKSGSTVVISYDTNDCTGKQSLYFTFGATCTPDAAAIGYYQTNDCVGGPTAPADTSGAAMTRVQHLFWSVMVFGTMMVMN